MAGKPPINQPIRSAASLDPNLARENHGEMFQGITLPRHDLALLELPHFEMLREPGELLRGQIGEDLDLAKILD